MPLENPPAVTLNAADLAVCRALLSRGSRSFSVASWLLPRRIRGPAAAFYAFCRVADDLVDDGDANEGLAELRRRVGNVYAGTRLDDPIDRALASVVGKAQIPRGVIDALLEGFAWDAENRRYPTIEAVHDYGVRVASTVGVVMTMLMGVRDPATLARACDLGAAMQLTNIARDVGEDARRGRVYLPLRWLEREGVAVSQWLRDPRPSPGIGQVTLDLLDEADRLYASAASGIATLPRDCRPAIRAASLIYRDIGRVIRSRGGDSVSSRARVSGARKLWLLGRAAWGHDPLEGRERPPLDAARALVAVAGART